MFQFLNDGKFFVVNVAKLWIFLQKYPSTILITYFLFFLFFLFIYFFI